MLRESNTESGSEADDEQNGDTGAIGKNGKNVEVMSEPPDPVDTSIFNPPVLCMGVAICQYVRLAFRLCCCCVVVAVVGVVLFVVVETTTQIDCSSRPFVNTSEWFVLSCVGPRPTFANMFT